MVNLLRSQEQISTGLKINRPSDDPINATATIRMDSTLEAQQQYLNNIDRASKVTNVADGTLASMSDLINQAHSIGTDN